MFQGKKKCLTFSFDDGVTQDKRLVKILDSCGLKATFNINSGLLGTPGYLRRENMWIGHNKIELNEAADLYKNHEVAAHTLTHPHLTDLGEQFIELETEEPKVFYIWGHSYELDYHDDWEKFEKFCKMMGGRDDIFYGTNREILL